MSAPPHLFVLLFLTHLAGLSLSDTICEYTKFTGDDEVHALCKPANTSCMDVTKGVNADDRILIVKLHNDLRERTAKGTYNAGKFTLPQASNMRQMTWNEELAKIAQAHTEQCGLILNCFNCRTVEDFTTGENIYFSSSNSEPRKVDWNTIFNKWRESGRSLTTIGSARKGANTFTQLIWGETKEIGCGRTVFKQAGKPNTIFYDFISCIYGPAGNNDAVPVYVSGTPCTDCNYKNTCCGSSCKGSNSYPSLCKLVS